MTTSSYQALGMTVFLIQPSLESQVEYLRFRFSNIRFKAFVLGLVLSYQSLDYEPISRTFLDVGNSIRANDYRLAYIDVFRPSFLAPHDLPPVDHPIPQGIPFVAQPLQQVPLA